jgi:hypothetical protein
MTICPICKTKLLPIVYGVVSPKMLDLQDQGKILIGMDDTSKVNSFCPLCEEAYADFTDMPKN